MSGDSKAIVGRKDERGRSLKMILGIVIGVAMLAMVVIVIALSRQANKHTEKSQKTPEQTYLESSNYNSLKPDQKVNVALSKVNQLMAVNGYTEAQVQLDQIKRDYPSAESDLDFLVSEFMVSVALNNTIAAKDAALKIQALKKDLPPQYQYIKENINKYAQS